MEKKELKEAKKNNLQRRNEKRKRQYYPFRGYKEDNLKIVISRLTDENPR